MIVPKYYLEFFLEKILSLGTTQLLNLIITVFLISFLLKLMGPTLWGEFILIQIFTTYLGWLCQWSFSFKEIREISQNRNIIENVKQIFNEAITIQLYFSLISILILLVIFKSELIEVELIALIGPFLIILGHGTHYSWFLSGLELFWQNAIFPILQKIIIFLTIIFIFQSNINVTLLLIIYGASSIFINLISIIYIYIKLKIYPKIVFNKNLFFRLKNGYPYFISSIMSNSKNSLIPIFLGIYHGELYVGLFSAIDRIKSLVVQMSQPIIQALYPRISYLVSTNKTQAQKMKNFFLALTIVLVLPIVLLIIFFPNFIINIFAGNEYIDASNELRLLIIVSLLTILSEYNLYQIVLARGMKKLFFFINLFVLFAVLFLCMFIVKAYGIIGAIISISFYEILTIFLILLGSKLYAK